jgi:Spy/CpxP family protein refolding chaperone
VYLAVGSLGFCTYVFSTVFVYASEKAYLQSTTVTRANSFISDPESSGGISEKDMQAGMNTKQHDLGSKPEDQVRAVPARGRRDRDAQTDMTQESVRSVRSRRQLLI